jgi:hypothetical protein
LCGARTRASTPAPPPLVGYATLRGFVSASGVDDLPDFDAAALLKDGAATGHGCRTIEAVGVDDDVAAQLIGPRWPATDFANLPNPVAEIGDRVFDLLKARRPPTLLFGGQPPPYLPRNVST